MTFMKRDVERKILGILGILENLNLGQSWAKVAFFSLMIEEEPFQESSSSCHTYPLTQDFHKQRDMASQAGGRGKFLACNRII